MPSGVHTLEEGPNLSIEQQTKILDLALLGWPIQRICKELDIVERTLFRYLKRDPLFHASWSESRQTGAEMIADQLQTVHEGCETVADAMILRARSDNLKTIAAWRNPKRYSPKQQVEVTHTVDLSQALQQAEQRAHVVHTSKSALMADQHKWNPFDPIRDANERAHRDTLKEQAQLRAAAFKRSPLPDVIPEYKDINEGTSESLKPGLRDTTDDASVMNTGTSVVDCIDQTIEDAIVQPIETTGKDFDQFL